MPQNPDELGALWMKSGSKGEYMTGTINGQAVVVFKNDRKEAGSKQPDWRVLKSKPKEERETAAREAGDW
jgi:uncharacterized protein (DUF736 family)